MPRRLVPIAIALAALLLGAWWVRRDRGGVHYTGFVEGEERIIRSEVSGRVLEVAFREGDRVPAGAVLARLDDADIQSRLAAKRQEIAVHDADVRTQEERITLLRQTWERDLSARGADVAQAETTAAVADRSFAREQGLVRTGASTAQDLDDRRAARDQARSALARAREMLARSRAEERQITVAANDLETIRQKRALAEAQRAELEVTLAKYTIRAPAVATVVQTQLIWPGELAQGGSAVVSVLDPNDKYVQVYVPVADVGAFRIGRRAEIELDSAPGTRIPGEVSFVADQASFTPEKIETRDDRLGQVYRAKIRILEGVERLQPGTEGNVYLVGASG